MGKKTSFVTSLHWIEKFLSCWESLIENMIKFAEKFTQIFDLRDLWMKNLFLHFISDDDQQKIFKHRMAIVQKNSWARNKKIFIFQNLTFFFKVFEGRKRVWVLFSIKTKKNSMVLFLGPFRHSKDKKNIAKILSFFSIKEFFSWWRKYSFFFY